MTGIVGIWLSGCADASRFADSGNPFSNPFRTASADDAVAPTPRVASTPLRPAKAYNNSYATSARPSPTVASAAPTPSPQSTGAIRPRPEPVGGTAAGWSAVGGSPIVVAQADDAQTLSARYGVPEAALLSANGLHSRSEIHGGMRIVVPVYNASARGDARVAKADSEEGKIHRVTKRDDDADDSDTRKSDRAEADHKKHKAEARKDDDSDGDGDKPQKKSAKAEKSKHDKTAKADDEEDKPAKSEKVAKADKAEKAAKAEKIAKAEKPTHEKVAEAPKAAPKPAPEVAKAEPAHQPKKPQTDATPTGDVATAQSDASKAAENGQFRWPARGRIIQGFKTGGNDGINIALPEGTSVRAAEDGKVAYAGSALKGYGNLVLIRHASGFVTAYANNGELDVKSGDAVKRGQVIAKSGQTGDVSTPQLHFELRKGQTPVDPTNYLAGL